MKLIDYNIPDPRIYRREKGFLTEAKWLSQEMLARIGFMIFLKLAPSYMLKDAAKTLADLR